MANGLEDLENLHAKASNIGSQFAHWGSKDIRKVYFETIEGQVAVCITNIRINMRFAELNNAEFMTLFNDDQRQADNYIFQIRQNMAEAIMDAALFQSELVFRFLYYKITGELPGKEKNLFKIIARIFNDVENNWVKDECKQIVLMWTLRNTIHTGGIYFVKTEGYSLNYKGSEYKFEFGKAPEFIKDGYSMTMVYDLIDSLKALFDTQQIKDLGPMDHPNFAALGY